jgi:hypothetical protein
MTPQEDSPLICKDDGAQIQHPPILVPMGLGLETSHDVKNARTSNDHIPSSARAVFGRVVVVVTLFALAVFVGTRALGGTEAAKAGGGALVPAGPYRLVDAQVGRVFFSYYDFFDGPDSLGSAGHNTYVSRAKAEELGIVGIVTEGGGTITGGVEEEEEEFVYMSSSPTHHGPRDSVRLEGKRRFDRGLFILDVRHMPDGCGVWPAFWLTDEANWPMNGEVDILEGTLTLWIIIALPLFSGQVNCE